MAQIPLQTLEELDITAEEFEALVAAGLVTAVGAVLDAEGVEEALAQADQSALDAILVFWATYVASTLVPSLEASMISAGLETVARLAGALSNPLTLISDQPLDTEQYLLQAQNRLVGIGNELWFNARTVLAEGIALGESQPKLAARVREAVGVTEPRARVIARTESHGARNVAAMMTMQRFESAYGVPPGVMRKEWQATNDPRTRHTHVEADGQVVGFADPFSVGGASLAFPGDPTGPPQEIINCRCATYAVFDPADLDLNDNGTVVTLNAAAVPGEDTAMPWHIVPDHAECGMGQFAVVKDDDGEVEGCHDTEEAAQNQLAALYASEDDDSTSLRWAKVSGPIILEDRTTGDRRQFAADSLNWQQVGSTASSLEIPLGYQFERGHGDGGSDKVSRVGRIDRIERRDGELYAYGVIDLQSPRGLEAARQMGTRDNPGTLAGVSVIVDEDPDGPGIVMEYQFAEGCESEEEGFTEACAIPERTIIHQGARVRAVDLVDVPAFAEARLYLDAPLPEEVHAAETITASAYTITIPELPPAAWFEEPSEEPDIGAITVTDEGRIFGYLAPKNVAHRSYRDKRVTVPTRNVDYGIWMNRATLADDGAAGYVRVPTGPITMDCGHAPNSNRLVGAARREHYDNSCSVVATARVGENARGVWIAGALVPGVTVEQVTRMMACQLSGDWGPHREKPGKRELVAAHVVPVPGFPVAHHSFTMHGTELSRTMTPIRFGVVQAGDDLTSFRAAADRMAAQIGRDLSSRAKALAQEVQELVKGES